MDTSLKLTGTLIVLSITLVTAFNLINSFNNHATIKLLANDLNNLGNAMKTLKDTSDQGSWQEVTITIPSNYQLLFNNETNKLEVHGAEEFNITLNHNITYQLNLSSGSHKVQLYYGPLSFNELKNETINFK